MQVRVKKMLVPLRTPAAVARAGVAKYRQDRGSPTDGDADAAR
jgi:hypothetical protein